MKLAAPLDRKLIEQAIQKAVRGGAVSAPPMPGTPPESDINFVRAQTDVGIDRPGENFFTVEMPGRNKGSRPSDGH